MFFNFCEASRDLVIVLTLIPLLALELNSSLTCPFTDISLAILGSWTKEDPLLVPGGTSPVVTYFRHSKTDRRLLLEDLCEVMTGDVTYDSSFTTTVLTQNESQRGGELDVLPVVLGGSEGADTLDL